MNFRLSAVLSLELPLTNHLRLSDNHDIISMKLYELESLKKVRLLDSRAQMFTVLF